MTRVKLCGLRTVEEIDHAIRSGADRVGIVVQAPRSHRNVPLEKARELVDAASPGKAVLVTPTGDRQALHEALDAVEPGTVQATGPLDAQALQEARERGVRLWRGLRPRKNVEDTLAGIRDALTVADRVVLDALQQGYGGRGEAVDRALARSVVEQAPEGSIVLAGGLTPDNVGSVVSTVGPWCVDVSSGIETDEENDPERMRAFVDAAKGAPA